MNHSQGIRLVPLRARMNKLSVIFLSVKQTIPLQTGGQWIFEKCFFSIHVGDLQAIRSLYMSLS